VEVGTMIAHLQICIANIDMVTVEKFYLTNTDHIKAGNITEKQNTNNNGNLCRM